jgi:3',5'-cyclic-AMP phosphodiesterase
MEKIAFVSDIHLEEQFPIENKVDSTSNWEKIIKDIKSRNIQKVIFGGDIGEPTAHRWFFETLKPFSVKLILGNHDNSDQISKYFWEGYDSSELFYQLENDYYKFIFLDTSSDEISRRQMSWLQSELITPKKIVIFVHHPVFPIATPIEKMAPLKNREELKQILQNSSQEITLFCGHYHMNDEMTQDNISQITTQSSSFQLVKRDDEIKVDNSVFGYRIIDFTKENIFTELIDFKNTNAQHMV